MSFALASDLNAQKSSESKSETDVSVSSTAIKAAAKKKESDTLDLKSLYKANNPKASATSKYGIKDEGELFAEAFSDVYEKGKDAKPLHIEIVASRRA